MKQKPITREEFDAFVRQCEEDAAKRPQLRIMVHPRDLEAAKKFFNGGKEVA